MNVQLNERFVAYGLEAVNLAGLDHKNVARASLELLTIDVICSAARLNELDFVVWMSVRSRPASRLSVEQENTDFHFAVVSADKVV